MNADDRTDREERRLRGEATAPQDKVPTYQELLDEAVAYTFPASDPIATGAAMHVNAPVATSRDAADWTLQPGASAPVRPTAQAPLPTPGPFPFPTRAAHAASPEEDRRDDAPDEEEPPAGR